MHWAGDVCPGVSAWGVSAQGGDCLGGVCLGGCQPGGVYLGCLLRGCLTGGCLPQCMLGYTPPPVDRMTDACEKLPCRNYVAGGNKCIAEDLLPPVLWLKYVSIRIQDYPLGALVTVRTRPTARIRDVSALRSTTHHWMFAVITLSHRYLIELIRPVCQVFYLWLFSFHGYDLFSFEENKF